jgi:hypothetical protein
LTAKGEKLYTNGGNEEENNGYVVFKLNIHRSTGKYGGAEREKRLRLPHPFQWRDPDDL